MLFLSWAKGLNAKDILTEMFDIRKSQMMSYQVRKWLRQQSKYFYVAGFDAPVKRRDKCISIGGGYVEKYMFFF
jgi:hypothetical protein